MRHFCLTLTYYVHMVQVVSKKKLDMASQEEYHERLSQKFDKIERERRSKEEAAASGAPAQSDDDAALGGRILLVTHVNTFLYAACFFIQVGTLPVRERERGHNECALSTL